MTKECLLEKKKTSWAGKGGGDERRGESFPLFCYMKRENKDESKCQKQTFDFIVTVSRRVKEVFSHILIVSLTLHSDEPKLGKGKQNCALLPCIFFFPSR